MEGNYPRFTPEMKKTHKILIPNMAPVQFRILAAAMEHQGYQVELLEVVQEAVSSGGAHLVAERNHFAKQILVDGGHGMRGGILLIGLVELNLGSVRQGNVFVDAAHFRL